MKYSLILMSIFGLLGANRSQADDVLPPRFNFDRYSRMVDHSPFAIATAVALPSATPNFAKDLYVANAAHSPEGDLVTIASSSDQNFKKYLNTTEPVDGYSIASIEWSDRVGATKVTISKDGNFATLTFNQALLSQPLSNVPPTPVPSQPNVAGRAAAMLPPSTPPLQAPRPHVRGVIQRNPKAVPMPAPNRSNL
ncbi:MAG: hypothetical protein DME75_02475 [Verrucomicrobia bacterium]|nr:MAG: hypothetical protein DME75_02475 [Verrucomicrobiota bacterium]